MPSIIEGYNYDIFISYRQKDNKGDRWVSEFVEALETELESTFKEEISVYFDINPHDGLLETHDVDASLKDKLKCLVFIPIISRTYCDPKSFAWEHEFKAFVEMALMDKFGLKVKLPNGNITSRVLPVRIYSLDNSDINLCESVLTGKLRGVEFIYSEPGVNRPLKIDDDEKINLNKTKYRNQINKVGNAIKEIISGLKAEPTTLDKKMNPHQEPEEEVKKDERTRVQKYPFTIHRLKLLFGPLLIVILIVVAIFAYPKIFKKVTTDKLRSPGERITVVVLPFQNMSNDTIWNVWQNIVQDNLINYLSNYTEELRVTQAESINTLIQSLRQNSKSTINTNIARIISRKLDADVFIKGSITEAGGVIRINAQIVDSRKEEALKTFQMNGQSSEDVILRISDSLRKEIGNYLIISKLVMQGPADMERKFTEYTSSPDAYRYFIYGQNSFWSRNWNEAKNWLSKAVQIDSTLFTANMMLCYTYEFTDSMIKAKQMTRKLYLKRDQMTVAQQITTDHLYAHYFGTLQDRIKASKQYELLDDQSPVNNYTIASNYLSLEQYDLAITEFEKVLSIYEKIGTDPSAIWSYTELGVAYHRTGQYQKEKKLYKKAEKSFPDNPDLIFRIAVLSLTTGDERNANLYIEKYRLVCKEKSWSEANMTKNLADLYSESGKLEEAEEYYRKSLRLAEQEPDNSWYLNNCAYFLIDKDRNVAEGMVLVEKALSSSPDDYSYLHTKGWGLFKQGRFKESVNILEKSWNLRMENSIYNSDAHLAHNHLDEAKKAVANQK